MTTLAIVLVVFGVFIFVDHQRWLLPDALYCQIGAGELRETLPQARHALRSEVTSWAGKQYCLHGSISDAMIGHHDCDWYQGSMP